MKLIGFGDSFVEGLIKQPTENTLQERHNISFVNQITSFSKYINKSENQGLRGNANQKIAYDCYSYLRDNDTDNIFVIVAWSGLDRQSYYYPDTDVYQCDGEETIFSKEEPKFFKDGMMLLLHQLMESKDIPHLFVESFEYYDSDVISYEQFPYVKTHLAELSKDLAPCLHPSISGHMTIAKKLSPLIDKEIDKYSKLM